LYPVYIKTEEGVFSKQHITFGALGDSFYEYLLKQWLISSKTETIYFEMYKESINSLKKHLISKTKNLNLFYVNEMFNYQNIFPKFDHLVCFLPGLIALGLFFKYFLNLR
jgi:hypothetical protein